MRAGLFLALIAAAVAAEPLKDYRATVRNLDRSERKFWSSFRDDFNAAYKACVAPILGGDPEATRDFTELRALFAKYRKLQESFAKAYADLAASKHAKASNTLFKEFLATCKAIDKAEAEIADTNPIHRYMYDQQPAVLRDGLEIRLAALTKAIAAWPELAAMGWKRAKKLDGKRSVVRRVAVIDALGIADAKETLTGLITSREVPLRAAVAESLFDRTALIPLLSDKSPVVRRTLLAAIARKADPRWVDPVIDLLKRSHGQEQVEAVAALTALSGQTFGHDAAKWTEWVDEYRKEIGEGRFDKSKIEIQETKPAPPKEQYRFYGIESSSRAVAAVILGSSILSAPVDWERRREKTAGYWAQTRKQWESEALPSHRTYLKRQFSAMLERFPSKGAYGLVALKGKLDVATSQKMLGLSKKDVGAAKKLLKRVAGRGWCPPMRGLQAAAELGAVDTIYFVDEGEVQGGSYITPELLIAAFRRWNRFRRIVVHAVRIDNQKEPGETLMKGLAEASGGTYVWLKAPNGG